MFGQRASTESRKNYMQKYEYPPVNRTDLGIPEFFACYAILHTSMHPHTHNINAHTPTYCQSYQLELSSKNESIGGIHCCDIISICKSSMMSVTPTVNKNTAGISHHWT